MRKFETTAKIARVIDADAVDVTVRLPMTGIVAAPSLELARAREALHRLAILAEWGITQPSQKYAPEARHLYDLDALVEALLDDERVAEVVAWSGKGLHESPWFMKALLNPEGDREHTSE